MKNRIELLKDLKTDVYCSKLLKKLSSAEIFFIEGYLILFSHLNIDDFAVTVNRLFVDDSPPFPCKDRGRLVCDILLTVNNKFRDQKGE